jgi:hypothetical protein
MNVLLKLRINQIVTVRTETEVKLLNGMYVIGRGEEKLFNEERTLYDVKGER